MGTTHSSEERLRLTFSSRISWFMVCKYASSSVPFTYMVRKTLFAPKKDPMLTECLESILENLFQQDPIFNLQVRAMENIHEKVVTSMTEKG